MSADTPENKAIEAMARAMSLANQPMTDPGKLGLRGQLGEAPHWQRFYERPARAALLALAETITEEMAERGGRVLMRHPDRDADDLARACFAEMCRAAAGTDREGG